MFRLRLSGFVFGSISKTGDKEFSPYEFLGSGIKGPLFDNKGFKINTTFDNRTELSWTGRQSTFPILTMCPAALETRPNPVYTCQDNG
jgi:hypothetical protein